MSDIASLRAYYRTVSIPMFGHVESFNVATATAILCYEVRRQTGQPPE